MSDATSAPAVVLTEFREWVDEWAEIYRDNWQSPDRDRKETILKNSMGTQLDHVRELVSAVIPVEPIADRWNDDVNVDPFLGIFQNPRLGADLILLLNRAIGIYERAGTRRLSNVRSELTLDLTFVKDAPLREVLERNAEELADALAAEAWTSAIVLAGAIAEGVLIFGMKARQASAVVAAAVVAADPSRNRGGRKPKPTVEDWKLFFLVEVAAEMGLLKGTTKGLTHGVLREFRNMIHPYVQLRDNLRPDKTAAEGSRLYLQSLVEDVRNAPP